MKNVILLGVLGLAACGDDGGSGSVDSPVVPTTVTVTGTSFEITLGGKTPFGPANVAAYAVTDEATPVAMTTSAATTGNYTLTITSSGALDGYLLATAMGKKDTYLYPAGPLTADVANATLLMLTTGTFDAAATFAGVNQDPTKGWIGVQVYTTDNMAVPNATVTSSPAGTVKYNGSNGFPSSSATKTGADGIAYIFNVTAGTVTISAAATGLTFKSHPVNARPDQVTTTLVQP